MSVPQDPGGLQGVPKNLRQFAIPWSRLDPIALSILNDPARRDEVVHSDYTHFIAYACARVGVSQVLTTEMLSLWTPSAVVRRRVPQMVEYAHREYQVNENRRLLAISAPDIGSLPWRTGKLYAALYELQGKKLYMPFKASYSQIMRLSGLSRSTVIRGVKELESACFIEREAGGPSGSTGTGNTETYYQILTDLQRLAALQGVVKP